jgi:hypothetical protein
MFCRCMTQWRAATSGVIGLDYVAVQWLFRLYEVANPLELLEDLQVMEGAAMALINKQAEG